MKKHAIPLPETDHIDPQWDQQWLTIWLNQPATRNALDSKMLHELRAVLQAVHPHRWVRGITLRGRGGVFCAGGDLKGFQALSQGKAVDPAEIAQTSRDAGELFRMINTMPQVVVMLVEGAAMAGGLGIVCTGDVVAVTRDARFALTETKLGIPPAQIAPFVVQRIGLSAARRLMLTATQFDGSGALKLGIADYVVDSADQLDPLEHSIRAGVYQCAPGANAITKELLHASVQLESDAMTDLAAKRFTECLLSDEGREGIASFIEKRKPEWAT